MGITSRIKHAWDAFNRPGKTYYEDYGLASGMRPDLSSSYYGVANRSIVGAIFNRIAIDVASADIRHVILDDKDKTIKNVNSGINRCFALEANLDQNSRDFVQDVVYSMFDNGCIAVIPVRTNLDPELTKGYDITEMRTAEILQWYPMHLQVRAYNPDSGMREDIIMEKRHCLVIENPLNIVSDDSNSVIKRLKDKLALLDSVDAKSSGSKLDLIFQFPYTIKNETKRLEAEKRIADIERQLNESKYGIAYADGSEKVIQLNRAAVNTLVDQITALKQELYDQLGLTETVLNGTATENEMLNYYSRTIDPILETITLEATRKWISKTAYTQGHRILYRRDPFKIVPIEKIAEIGDTFTRNEILTPNEIRKIIGFAPNTDPNADKLANRNIAEKNNPNSAISTTKTEEQNQNGGSNYEKQEL